VVAKAHPDPLPYLDIDSMASGRLSHRALEAREQVMRLETFDPVLDDLSCLEERH